MTYDALIPVIRRLALQAGDKIMQIYEADDFDVKVKSDSSPVTEADEAADALISVGLREAFPDILLVTEEQAASHSEKGDTFLIVDPLDGTKEFINRRGDFTVNIALVENGVPTRWCGLRTGAGADVLHASRWASCRGNRRTGQRSAGCVDANISL